MANCAYHPERDAVGACVNCGKLICEECKTILGEKIYCAPCSRLLAAESTSGQGSLAMIPEEIRGWNWGAFVLCWIWGIGNKVWIALLALLPFVGFIMNIVLGIKGNEWAWRNKKWDSVANFKTTQRTWAIVGLVLLIPYVIGTFGVFAAIVIPNVGRFIGRGEEEARRTEYHNMSSAVIALMIDNNLMTIPNPHNYAAGIAYYDMTAFPDSTTTAANKGYTGVGNPKAGYVLYAHDLIGSDPYTFKTVNYVTRTTTKYYYTCEADGRVRQFDGADVATAMEYTYGAAAPSLAPAPAPAPKPAPAPAPKPALAPAPAPAPVETEEARRTEYHNMSSAVIALMIDNNLMTIPNPHNYAAGIAYYDMTAFPDSTTTAANKGYTGVGNPKAGYVLYAHDLIGSDPYTFKTVNYVTRTTTKYYYTCEADGRVRQFAGADVATAMEYKY